MRNIEVNGVTVTIEPRELPAHPTARAGRTKGPIRLVCEALNPGESAFLPLSAKAINSANLYGISKATGREFRYRTEGKGVRVYRVDGGKEKPASGARLWDIRAA